MKPQMLAFAALMITALAGLSSCRRVSKIVGNAVESIREQSASAQQPETTPSPVGQVPEMPKEAKDTFTIVPVEPVVREIGARDYDAFVAVPGRLAFVVYKREGTAQCLSLLGVLEGMAAGSGGKLVIGKIDVDRDSSLAAKAGVRRIPDTRLFRDGREVERFVGIEETAEIQELVVKHSAGLKQAAAGTAQVPASPASSPAPAGKMERMEKDWIPPGMRRR